jgi:hypothetical protein
MIVSLNKRTLDLVVVLPNSGKTTLTVPKGSTVADVVVAALLADCPETPHFATTFLAQLEDLNAERQALLSYRV